MEGVDFNVDCRCKVILDLLKWSSTGKYIIGLQNANPLYLKSGIPFWVPWDPSLTDSSWPSWEWSEFPISCTLVLGSFTWAMYGEELLALVNETWEASTPPAVGYERKPLESSSLMSNWRSSGLISKSKSIVIYSLHANLVCGCRQGTGGRRDWLNSDRMKLSKICTLAELHQSHY